MSLGQLWPQPGLLAGYHLNANSNDFSGSGYNGTDANITYALGSIGGNGASFNGSSSKIALSSSLDTPLKTGSFTQVMIVKVPSSWTYIFGVCRGRVTSGSNYGIYFAIESAGITVQRCEGNATSYTKTLATTISNNKKYFIVWTYDKSSGATKIYCGCLESSGVFVSDSATFGTGNVSYHASYDVGYNIGANLRNVSDKYGWGVINEYLIFSDVKNDQWVRNYYTLLRGGLLS